MRRFSALALALLLAASALTMASCGHRDEREPEDVTEELYDVYEGDGFSFEYDGDACSVAETDGVVRIEPSGASERISLYKRRTAGGPGTVTVKSAREAIENTGQYGDLFGGFLLKYTEISGAPACVIEYSASMRTNSEWEILRVTSVMIACSDGDTLTVTLRQPHAAAPTRSETMVRLISTLTV